MVDKKKNAKNTGAPLISSVKLFDFSVISIVIIIILLGVIGYMYYSECGKKSPDGTSLSIDYCSENIIPDYVVFRTLQSEIENGPREYGDITSRWKDESPISLSPRWFVNKINLRCTSDEQYFYCDNLYYVRTSVNPAGEAGEIKEYLVNLILDKTNSKVIHYHPEGWTAAFDLNVANNVVNYTCTEV